MADPAPRPNYHLREVDGLIWVYADGVRHSRYGVRMPENGRGRRALEAVPDLLNKKKLPFSVQMDAFSFYLHFLW
jgi:hypothetical protein